MAFKKRRMRRRRKKSGKSLRKIIKNVIASESEKKIFNASHNELDLTDIKPLISTLNFIVPGDARNQRIGNKLEPKFLKIKFQIKKNVSANADAVRVFVIQNLTDVAPSDLPETILDFMPSFELATVGYKVLYDRTFDLSLGVHGNMVRNIKIRVPRMLGHNQYDNPGSFVKGEIRIHVITDNVDTDEISFLSQSRFRYTDS